MTRRRSEHGAALLEVLLAATFGAALIGTTYAWAAAALASLHDSDVTSRTQRALLVALEEMAGDVRSAGASLGASPVEAIAVARTDELGLTSDLDGDGGSDGRNERIIYRFDAPAGLLRRGVGNGGAQPYVDGLLDHDVRFHYLAADGSELVPGAAGLNATQRATVAVVRVRVTAGATQRERLGLAMALRNRP